MFLKYLALIYLVGGVGKTKTNDVGDLFLLGMTTETILGVDIACGSWINVVDTKMTKTMR
jgi:hypothetical protein